MAAEHHAALAVLAVRRGLTKKEQDIVECAVVGLSNREIAAQLGTTEQVIKNHMKDIYVKMGVENRIYLLLQYYAKPIAEYRDFLARCGRTGAEIHSVHLDARQ